MAESENSSNSVSYEQFVVVAEGEWKLYSYDPNVETEFVFSFANLNWKCRYRFYAEADEYEDESFDFWLEGEEYGSYELDGAHIEVFLCHQKTDGEGPFIASKEMPKRYIFDRSNWDTEFIHSFPAHYKCIKLTVRLLKERSLFPDFTQENVQLGLFKWNAKLRVGEHVFHVNKELLAKFSPHFDRMFNGEFKEAKQDEIELKGETELANPLAFHDFLLFMMPIFPGEYEVLPNSKNVAALLDLAKFYQVDSIRDKCARHLVHCHEMPAWERIVLAKKHGLKELQYGIAEECTEEDWKKLGELYMETDV